MSMSLALLCSISWSPGKAAPWKAAMVQVCNKYDLNLIVLGRSRLNRWSPWGIKNFLKKVRKRYDPVFVVVPGSYWVRIGNTLRTRKERGDLSRDITRDDIKRDRTVLGSHAVVLDPDLSWKSGKWAFKNSHGDDRFYLDDGAMTKLISKDQHVLFVAKPNQD